MQRVLGLLAACLSAEAFLCGQNGGRVKSALCRALTSAGVSEKDAETCAGKQGEWECFKGRVKDVSEGERLVTCVAYSLNDTDPCDSSTLVCAGAGDTFGSLDQQAVLVNEVLIGWEKNRSVCHSSCPVWPNCSTQAPTASPSKGPVIGAAVATNAPSQVPTSNPTMSPSLDLLRSMLKGGWEYLAYAPGGLWPEEGGEVKLGKVMGVAQNRLLLNVSGWVDGELRSRIVFANITEVRQICDLMLYNNDSHSYNDLEASLTRPSDLIGFPCGCERKRKLEVYITTQLWADVNHPDFRRCRWRNDVAVQHTGYQDCVTNLTCNCIVSNWSSHWNPCVHDGSCGAVGLRNRTRNVTQPHAGSGERCPELVQYDACNAAECSRHLGDYWWDWLAFVVAPVVCLCWVFMMWYRVWDR
eukprot:Hpha_TRINITY_DN3991_c0_g1::TRINITY_DN3991_c0_g1_i1::g.18099::m.18099